MKKYGLMIHKGQIDEVEKLVLAGKATLENLIGGTFEIFKELG